MPTEQSQLEYYQYYRASQKRVKQWVQKTSQELEAGAERRSSDFRLKDGGGDSEDAGSGRKGSRRRSSSSKLQINAQIDSSRSRGPSSSSRKKAAKTTDDVRNTHTHTHTRSRKSYYSSDGLALSSLLPFGLFPLFFALTPPSVATLFAATILLAGYFCVDYGKQESISEKL
ncbi:hypothetical protein BYT27DRAFT_6896604 [Phlegmacium glaucopus]|nr:hypothetical protein BYT27DRAFT_6896604 [Phlegmacium glaucopus]